MMIDKKVKYSGFTLVELAVVLVILGLMAGGILTGKNLIENSRIRSLMTDGQSYVQAVKQFEDVYGGLPGDLYNAQDIWGAQSGSCPNDASNTQATCNGNGDGFIDEDGGSAGFERYRAWQHLSNAGFIKGKFSGTRSDGTGAEWDHSTPGENVPGPEYDKTIGFSINYHFNTDINGQKYHHYTTSMSQNHFVTLGSDHKTFGFADAPALSSRVTYEMDKKIDDGEPNTGIMVVYSEASDSAHANCTDTPSANVHVYELDNELDRSCAPHFRIP